MNNFSIFIINDGDLNIKKILSNKILEHSKEKIYVVNCSQDIEQYAGQYKVINYFTANNTIYQENKISNKILYSKINDFAAENNIEYYMIINDNLDNLYFTRNKSEIKINKLLVENINDIIILIVKFFQDTDCELFYLNRKNDGTKSFNHFICFIKTDNNLDFSFFKNPEEYGLRFPKVYTSNSFHYCGFIEENMPDENAESYDTISENYYRIVYNPIKYINKIFREDENFQNKIVKKWAVQTSPQIIKSNSERTETSVKKHSSILSKIKR